MRWIGKSRKYRMIVLSKENARARRDKLSSFICFGLCAGMFLLGAILVVRHLEKRVYPEWQNLQQEMEQKERTAQEERAKSYSKEQLQSQGSSQ